MLILSTKLRNALKASGLSLRFDLKNIVINGVKRGCSGFVTNEQTGTIVYVNTEGPCGFTPKYMFRFADNDRDDTGYHNRWANTFDDLVKGISACLLSSPQKQNECRI